MVCHCAVGAALLLLVYFLSVMQCQIHCLELRITMSGMLHVMTEPLCLYGTVVLHCDQEGDTISATGSLQIDGYLVTSDYLSLYLKLSGSDSEPTEADVGYSPQHNGGLHGAEQRTTQTCKGGVATVR